MKLTDRLREVFKKAASALKGTARRTFMAGIVKELGEGGQRLAQVELGWNRSTIRKGQRELDTGVEIPDGRSNNRPKTVEERLPNLRQHIQEIVEPQCQADPTFRTTRKYRKITSAKVHKLLVEEKGYLLEQLPSEETIRKMLNDMGYYPTRVRKTIPKKKSRKPI